MSKTSISLSTASVRQILKAAGLVPAKKQASTMVKGYTNVIRQGFALSYQTEYRAKQHQRTGRVVVDMLLSSWNADEDKAAADMDAVRALLTMAGFVVTEGASDRQLIVVEA